MSAGEKNAYWCEDCRGYIVTIDRDDRVTTMFLACRVKGDPTEPHNDCSGGRVFTEFHHFLSSLALIDDPGVRAGLDGRVLRHGIGDVRPRAHRHAELEVNLVVRGTASYLRGDWRYALTPGTLTSLFPGQARAGPEAAAAFAVAAPRGRGRSEAIAPSTP